MKKQLLSIAVATILGAILAIPAHAIPTASLNLLDSDIQVGDSFDVQVIADGDGIGQALLAFGFMVSTTGSAFSYDGYVVESGFDDDSFFPDEVAGSSFPGIADDDVLLATLSFTGTAEGAGSIAIQGLFDGGFAGLYYGLDGFDIDDAIKVSVAPASVPEPATMLLLGTGLLGLAGLRKRHIKR